MLGEGGRAGPKPSQEEQGAPGLPQAQGSGLAELCARDEQAG